MNPFYFEVTYYDLTILKVLINSILAILPHIFYPKTSLTLQYLIFKFELAMNQEINTQTDTRDTLTRRTQFLDILKFNSSLKTQLHSFREDLENRVASTNQKLLNKIKNQSSNIFEKVSKEAEKHDAINRYSDNLKLKTQQLQQMFSKLKKQYDEKILKNQSMTNEMFLKNNIMNDSLERYRKGLQQIQFFTKQKQEYNKSFSNIRTSLISVQNQLKVKQHRKTQMLYEKRHFNNEIQSIKGNIRVYCRLRPLSTFQDEIDQNFFEVKDRTITFSMPKEYQKSENHKKNFNYSFQQVFHNSKQEDVFDQFGPLVDGILDGKTVCVFAYGPTGSGKTYTMLGAQGEQIGVVPRSIKRIFNNIQEVKSLQWKYSITVNCVQIYNDEIRDLFNKETKKQNYSTFDIKSESQIIQLLELANNNRKIAGTNCNQRSSRSHLIFNIKLIRKGKNITKQGSLILVDLAGSERVAVSNASGERLKQAQHINKSLSSLGLVIQHLMKKSPHIPFRNSKLTMFLEPYLTGESRTVMMMCISPLANDWAQTQSALAFSENVKKVVNTLQQKK